MQLKIINAAALLSLLLGCAASKITYSWKAPTIVPDSTQMYNKIMVVGLIKDNDKTVREKMENHLVGDLAERGYNAVSSLKEYGPKAFENMKEEEVMNQLKSSGINAIITIVLLDKERERYYMPARINYSPYVMYQSNFYGYYNTLLNRIYAPGYYMVDTKYFWESNFYDLQTKALIYSAQSKSFNPASTEALAHEYGKLIVKNMTAKGIIK
jgi:hypothetical protein